MMKDVIVLRSVKKLPIYINEAPVKSFMLFPGRNGSGGKCHW